MMASSSSSLIGCVLFTRAPLRYRVFPPFCGWNRNCSIDIGSERYYGDGRVLPDDIVVVQNATPPLPNGIPTYTAQVLNECVGGGSKCNIGDIHLSCGFFSSARLINPKTFRRIAPNDCLVNDGRPIAGGQLVTFQYANTFSYPLSVSSATCM